MSLTVDCDTAGQHKRTRLLLGGIFGLHFDIDPSWLGRAFLEEPWTYIELTSIEMTRDELNGHSVWRLKAELWESKLEVLCTEWQVTSDGLS